jgi:predicted component of type VI protein secretion system
LHDPEALREEVHSLNRKLDELRRLNQGLTGKLGNLEMENSEYEKIIQENECFWNIGSKSTDSTL